MVLYSRQNMADTYSEEPAIYYLTKELRRGGEHGGGKGESRRPNQFGAKDVMKKDGLEQDLEEEEEETEWAPKPLP